MSFRMNFQFIITKEVIILNSYFFSNYFKKFAKSYLCNFFLALALQVEKNSFDGARAQHFVFNFCFSNAVASLENKPNLT